MPDGGRDWLGITLRQLRDGAGLPQGAAESGGISQSRLSRLEGGRFVPRDGEIRTLCKLYGADAETRRALLQAASDLRPETVRARVAILHEGGWRIQDRIKRLEAASADVCVFQPLLVPGLLQTAEYARLVFADGGDITGDDLEKSIAKRMERADALASDRSFTLVVPEGALRWQAGSAELMLRQLEHITGVIGARPNVRFGVIPQSQPVDVFTTHGFSLYDHRTAVIGVRTGTSFIDDPRDLADYSKLFSEFEALAAFGSGALSAIERVAEGYRA